MKRTREEVQYGARPGPGGVGGSGGGGGGGGGTVTGNVVTAGATSVTTGAINIGTVVPGTHATTGGTTLSVGLGTGNITTSGSIAHHRILTPQHGGAQTIAYLPSTTPVTATNLKTSSGGIVADSSAAGNNDGNTTTVGGGGGGVSGRITQLGGNTVVTSGGGPGVGGNANTVVQQQTVQYSTCKCIN